MEISQGVLPVLYALLVLYAIVGCLVAAGILASVMQARPRDADRQQDEPASNGHDLLIPGPAEDQGAGFGAPSKELPSPAKKQPAKKPAKRASQKPAKKTPRKRGGK